MENKHNSMKIICRSIFILGIMSKPYNDLPHMTGGMEVGSSLSFDYFPPIFSPILPIHR